ncbi:MAG: hypothetical protein JNK42_02675 [Caedimonas sp.]|nr:hypothetical protein [Caedimonas sp.]
MSGWQEHPVFFQGLRAVLQQQSWQLLILSLKIFSCKYKLYDKIYNLFLVIFLFLTSAQAKDLGVYGETFPIIIIPII